MSGDRDWLHLLLLPLLVPLVLVPVLKPGAMGRPGIVADEDVDRDDDPGTPAPPPSEAEPDPSQVRRG